MLPLITGESRFKSHLTTNRICRDKQSITYTRWRFRAFRNSPLNNWLCFSWQDETTEAEGHLTGGSLHIRQNETSQERRSTMHGLLSCHSYELGFHQRKLYGETNFISILWSSYYTSPQQTHFLGFLSLSLGWLECLSLVHSGGPSDTSMVCAGISNC